MKYYLKSTNKKDEKDYHIFCIYDKPSGEIYYQEVFTTDVHKATGESEWEVYGGEYSRWGYNNWTFDIVLEEDVLLEMI